MTDPGRFGPPSAAALAYAREILAQAGAGAFPALGPNTGAPGASGLGGVSTTVIVLALLGLGAVFFLRD